MIELYAHVDLFEHWSQATQASLVNYQFRSIINYHVPVKLIIASLPGKRCHIARHLGKTNSWRPPSGHEFLKLPHPPQTWFTPLEKTSRQNHNPNTRIYGLNKHISRIDPNINSKCPFPNCLSEENSAQVLIDCPAHERHWTQIKPFSTNSPSHPNVLMSWATIT